MTAPVRELVANAAARLAGTSEAPLLDAQVLMCHVLKRDRSWLYAWPEHGVDEAACAAYSALVDARAAGRPVAQITGRREFWSLPLRVNAHTLIPRPETEHLVELALALDLPATAHVLDLGTGCGAIALALATQRPTWQITAVDKSRAALDVARDNALRLGIDRVTYRQGDWFGALPGTPAFDLIVSNPPYIAADDPHLESGDLRFEPAAALLSGADGLDDLRRIIATAPRFLTRGGWLWLEHGFRQGAAVRALLQRHGLTAIATRDDLAGHPRHTGGRLDTPTDARAGSRQQHTRP